MPKINQGRKRDLHPEFFRDERVLQVSMGARLLFQGLWTIADREGRLEEPHPVTLKATFLPVDHVDCAELLQELIEVGLVGRYEAKGVRILYLPGLKKRTRFHPKEVGSRLPPPPSEGLITRKVEPNGSWKEEEVDPGSVPSGHTEALRRPGSSGSSGSIGIVGSSDLSKVKPSGRARSRQEETYWTCQQARTDRLISLGMEPIPDEDLQPQRINATLLRIAKMLGIEDQDEAALAVVGLFELYLGKEWPLGPKFDRPYKFTVFAGEKTLRQLLEEQSRSREQQQEAEL
jgi:hypothetical protein